MKTFDMAKEKKKVQRQHPIHWVKICGYTVRWWEVPLVPFELFKDWRYNRMKWSDEKATKVLDAILPNELEWVEEDNAFYYCMDWNPHGIGKKRRSDIKIGLTSSVGSYMTSSAMVMKILTISSLISILLVKVG